MAICEVQFSCNNSLQKMIAANVIFPEKMTGPFPVLYLLHGLSDDHTAWARFTSLERYVGSLPLIVVMPNSERGWYTDSVTNPAAAFDSMIVKDLMGFVDGNFRTIAERGGRATAGLSMGGYGAVKLALKYPDKFCAGVSFSGAVEPGTRDAGKAEDSAFLRECHSIFGPIISGGPEDTFALAEKCDRALMPGLRLDCGVDDFLIQENRNFHAHLDKLGIAHEYEEHPGVHDWNYWDLSIQRALPFLTKHLGIKKPE